MAVVFGKVKTGPAKLDAQLQGETGTQGPFNQVPLSAFSQLDRDFGMSSGISRVSYGKNDLMGRSSVNEHG